MTDSQLIEACRLVVRERRLSQFAWSGWGCGASPSLGPDVAVILSGAALPRGGEWLVLVRRFAGGAGTLEIRKLGFGHSLRADADRADPEKGQATFWAADWTRLDEALTALRKTSTTSHFWSTVRDGVPAALTVWERGRGIVATEEPTKPLIFGTCIFGSGDIRIDAV